MILNIEKRLLIDNKKQVKLSKTETLILSRLSNNIRNTQEELYTNKAVSRNTIKKLRKLGLNINLMRKVGYLLKDDIRIC